jgi:hypothetical protein
MYRLQAALVLVMAGASLIGYLFIPSNTAARDAQVQPASFMQSSAREKIQAVLQTIPRYREHFKNLPRATFIIDRETDNDWLVYVGENTERHFQLRDTLRVWKHGRVDELRADGEWQTLISR